MKMVKSFSLDAEIMLNVTEESRQRLSNCSEVVNGILGKFFEEKKRKVSEKIANYQEIECGRCHAKYSSRLRVCPSCQTDTQDAIAIQMVREMRD